MDFVIQRDGVEILAESPFSGFSKLSWTQLLGLINIPGPQMAMGNFSHLVTNISSF